MAEIIFSDLAWVYCVSDVAAAGTIAVLALLLLACGGGLAGFLLKWRRVNAELQTHMLAVEQRKTIWVDYHFKPKHLVLTGEIGELTDQENWELSGDEVYDILNWIDEKESPFRSEIRHFFENEERYFYQDLRVKKKDGSYAWYSMMGTRVDDKWFVGCLNNVDSKMTQEKELTERAENDMLTGILNKKTMENKTTEALATRKDSEYLIFFMIDLDNFKSVNDTLGHIYGDKVLIEAADKLRKVFSHNALIGRLGGDEFAVCASFQAFDHDNLVDYMKQKGEEFCDTMRAHYVCDELGVSVSSSIGIAAAPWHGDDFLTIYQKADKALYLSKRSGKDQFNIFELSAEDKEG